MRDLAERSESQQVSSASPGAEDTTAAPAQHEPTPRGGLLPKAGATRDASELLSARNVANVRRANLDGQLKSNLWFEVSRIALWATTGLIALSVGVATGAVGIFASLGAAGVLLPLAGTVVAASILLFSSQKSKSLFADRWFDVQDFQMQRQAALIGKSVEHAMESQDTRWSDKFTARTAQQSWAQAVQGDKAASPQVTQL